MSNFKELTKLVTQNSSYNNPIRSYKSIQSVELSLARFIKVKVEFKDKYLFYYYVIIVLMDAKLICSFIKFEGFIYILNRYSVIAEFATNSLHLLRYRDHY